MGHVLLRSFLDPCLLAPRALQATHKNLVDEFAQHPLTRLRDQKVSSTRCTGREARSRWQGFNEG